MFPHGTNAACCELLCVRVQDYECVCVSVSGIKKPSRRRSPAVNETGPDVGAKQGDRMPLGAISLSHTHLVSLSPFTHTLTRAHTQTHTLMLFFTTADEFSNHIISRLQVNPR